MTFSIVAFDSSTGDLGIAVATRVLAVGAVVPWAKAGVGAIATQAGANTAYGPDGLRLLRDGRSAGEVVGQLTGDDPDAAVRQLGVVDARGRAATYTGVSCRPWAGGRLGAGYACQGNILTEGIVLDAMAATFEAMATSGGDLAVRLVAALAAGQAAGGDSRGRQSAALLVVREAGGWHGQNDRYVDLRVDDHTQPVDELARLLDLWRAARDLPPHGISVAAVPRIW